MKTPTTSASPSPLESFQTQEIEVIKFIVAKEFGVRISDLAGDERRTPLPMIRHVAMALSRELTGASLITIAGAFNRTNHVTVLHAECATEGRCLSSSSFKAQYLTILEKAKKALEAERARAVK